MTQRVRHLVLILGDQLDEDSAAFDGFDPKQDRLWMAEVDQEVGPVHQQKIVLFLSAMRHFAEARRNEGWPVEYHQLGLNPSDDRASGFRELLQRDLPRLKPQRLIVVQPGDHRVLQDLQAAADDAQLELEVREDRHFFSTLGDFESWSKGKKELVLEFFYRWMRKRTGILMEEGEPVGGAWNFDKDNRESFGKAGPPNHLQPLPRFEPDAITSEVIELVLRRFADNPGRADEFAMPVTAEGARRLLDAFITHALPSFGRYQDAMAQGDAILFHSRLSAPMNLKLLSPRAAVEAAVNAYHDGHAPIAAVEGFVRQILGWREFIRGVYWSRMPGYGELNALECESVDVPSFFWDGQTDMACVRDSMQQLLRHGYVHHIHRLMVLGLFSLLFGVHPRRFHDWHMAMYLDAVDWVSLPNTLGMSQYGDGGVVGTKPYAATGKYIDRMGPYCRQCPYNPSKAVGDQACPFTTLYWDFLGRHSERFRKNRRMALQVKNVDRKTTEEMEAIRQRAAVLKERVLRKDPV